MKRWVVYGMEKLTDPDGLAARLWFGVIGLAFCVLCLGVTRLFGLWPEWAIKAELVVKAWLR